MNRTRTVKVMLGLASAGAALQPHLACACAACYGQSDAPMAHGMNWGILSLLAIIVMVLVGVAGFFVYLARRAGALAATGVTGEMAGATERG